MGSELNNFDLSCSDFIPIILGQKIYFTLSLITEVIKSLKRKMTYSDL